jgi:hypothetical protein
LAFNVYTTDVGEEGIEFGKVYDYDFIRTCRAYCGHGGA